MRPECGLREEDAWKSFEDGDKQIEMFILEALGDLQRSSEFGEVYNHV